MRKRSKRVVFSWALVIMTVLSWSDAMADNNLVARRMSPMKIEEYASDVEKTAAAWTEMFLTSRYAPSKNMRYVYLYARDEQDLDMLRMRYDVGKECITLTQTACMFQIVVTPSDSKENMAENMREQAAQELARRLFRNGGDIVLETTAKSDARTEGHSNPEESQKAERWLGNLQWWCDGGEIGFTFIKDDGNPSAMDKGTDFELNARWFKGRAAGSKKKQSK